MDERDLESAFPKPGEIPEPWQPEVDETGRTLLIGGALRRFEGSAEEILSPVCTRPAPGRLAPVRLGPAARASAAEGHAALDAAVGAWADGRGEWPRASVRERVECCLDFARRAAPLREAVARALLWEVGKPWDACLKEVDRTLDYVRDTADALLEMERASASPVEADGFRARVRRAPLGVALCLGPYNYAVNEVFTLVIPALVMGNPVVIKTPRYGVRANALLAPALAEAFPPGVVSLVSGDGPTLVGPMMESGAVDVLALIGSQRTAKILLRQHPHPYRLRSVLGMGAKNPAVVLADADLDAAAAEIASGALAFNGQRCTALKLVFAQRPVAEALVERLAAAIDDLPVGMPWEEGVVITPLPDGERPEYLLDLVQDAVSRGARVVNRGGGERAGPLLRPALVHPVPRGARLRSVEQFGPVVPVAVFDDPEEVLADLAASPFGQQASLFGRDPAVLGPLVDHLANLVCRVNLNTQCRRGPDVLPFTGRKDSAAGTLSISDALRVFSIRSLVAERADGGLLAPLEGSSRFLARPD